MAAGPWCLRVFRSGCGLLLGSNCGSVMNLFLLPLLLLLSSVCIVFSGADTHLNVKRSAAYPRPNAAVTEEVNGRSGSSMLLDPKFTVDLSKEEVVWEWKKWNSTESLDILDHVPSRSPMFPSEQFEHRLQFNISNGSLTINPLECRDQGIYMVYVQGVKKKELHLRVYAVTEEVGSSGSSMLLDPKFTVDLSKEEVVWEWKKWNSTESLDILDHVPSRSPMFPSEQFEHRLQFNISNGSLTINPVERRDQGIYMVYVQGEKKKELHLRVYEKLSDAMILANSSSLGSTSQLTCNVSGDDPGYQWWFNGGEILGHHQLMDGNRILIIPVASARDCGIFTCEATNPVSSVRANYTLAVPGFLPKTITIVVLFIIELAVSLYRILPVLLCRWKMESVKAPKDRKCLLGFNLIDILLLVGIFITFIYWIMLKDADFISVLVLCPMFAQLLVLILPFIIPKLSWSSIECLQKFPGRDKRRSENGSTVKGEQILENCRN